MAPIINMINAVLSIGLIVMLGTLPSSTNYTLKAYGVGTGGSAGSSSTNYSANGITGEQAGSMSSTNYGAGAGENYLLQSDVPLVTLSNGNNWYDKLKLVLDPQGNPPDATYVVEISTDGFTTIQYVQSDFTVGSTLTPADYMTYAAWGGSSGVFLRGLQSSTVYSVRATAFHGVTQSKYSPISTAATVNPQLSFGLGVSPGYAQTSPPYSISLGSLLAGSVETASDRIWITMSTNADNGAFVWGGGQYGGLKSATTGHTIQSVAGSLATASEGFGDQAFGATQTSGGPLTIYSAHNATGANVGPDYPQLNEYFISAAPITDAEAGISLLAKSSTLTPAATDYTEVMTLVAAGSF